MLKAEFLLIYFAVFSLPRRANKLFIYVHLNYRVLFLLACFKFEKKLKNISKHWERLIP